MGKRIWYRESVEAEARKYTKVSDFKAGSRGAYKWAVRWRVLKEVTAFMFQVEGAKKPPGYWTRERCKAIAAPYDLLPDFIAEEWSCYKKCCELGIREEVTAHMARGRNNERSVTYGHWNVLENVIQEARKYVKRTDWSDHSPSSYTAAHRNGWIDLPEVTGHMWAPVRPAGYWQDPTNWAQLIDSARQHSTRAEWSLKASAEFNAARKIGGTLWEACVAMHEGHRAESDVVYIWAVVEEGQAADLSNPVDCKVGVTRSDLGEARISGCARNNGMGYEIVHMVTVKPGKAFELEKVILDMGAQLDMPDWMDGYTEFRRFGSVTLRQAIREMDQWAVMRAPLALAA
jgi:hypothetical protein